MGFRERGSTGGGSREEEHVDEPENLSSGRGGLQGEGLHRGRPQGGEHVVEPENLGSGRGGLQGEWLHRGVVEVGEGGLAPASTLSRGAGHRVVSHDVYCQQLLLGRKFKILGRCFSLI